MKIYTITEAIFLTGDFAGTNEEALGATASSFTDFKSAESKLEDWISERVGDHADNFDWSKEESDSTYDDIINSGELVSGSENNLRELSHEFCDRVCKWSLFEQEL